METPTVNFNFSRRCYPTFFVRAFLILVVWLGRSAFLRSALHSALASFRFRFVVRQTRRQRVGEFVDASRSLSFEFVFHEGLLSGRRRRWWNRLKRRKRRKWISSVRRRRRWAWATERIARRGSREEMHGRRNDAETDFRVDDWPMQIDDRFQSRGRGTGSRTRSRRLKFQRGNAKGGRWASLSGAAASV